MTCDIRFFTSPLKIRRKKMSQQQPLSLKTRQMYFAPNLKIPSLLAELMRKGKVLRRHLQSEVFGKFISAKRGHDNENRTFVTAKINMQSKKSKQDYLRLCFLKRNMMEI